MFNNLKDLSYERDIVEAIGFYIVYPILILLSATILSALLNIIFEFKPEVGLKIGHILAVVTPLIVSYLILKAKKTLGDFRYIFVLLLSGILGFFGFFIGFIPVAFLTTIANKDNKTLERNI